LRFEASECEDGSQDKENIFEPQPISNNSFMQQISTGSNTDSDLRVLRAPYDKLPKSIEMIRQSEAPRLKKSTEAQKKAAVRKSVMKEKSSVDYLFTAFRRDCDVS
jgi:hypothetical protein